MELSRENLTLLDMLLSKAEVETRIEIHHCRTYGFKDYLKKREEEIGTLRTGIKKALAVYDNPEHPEIGRRCVLACDGQGAAA